MEEKNVNAFFKMPKKVWDILVAAMLIIAIACVICECAFYFVRGIPKTTRLAIGIVGIISAFFMVLLFVYSYLPKVKMIWEEEKIQIMLHDPKNAELIAKYTSQNSQNVDSIDEESVEEKDLE